EGKRRQANSEGFKNRSLAIQFVHEGEKYRSDKLVRRQGCGRLEGACDWEMEADLGGKLVVPQEIVSTSQRPDIVLWSVSQRIVYFIELTVPWEDSVEEAYERKKLRYADLRAEAEQRGWKTRICPVEVGCRGFIARSAVSLLGNLECGGRV
ncbi:hypothetical protein P3436_25190, partial [Vibrio parahaemolyticus]|nr:hypothetical protein [Vibrio parahaemolyticus]